MRTELAEGSRMHPHVFMAAGHATQHAINLASQRMGHHHAQTLAKLKASVMEMMATKVTGAQITALRENFRFVAEMLAGEAKHHMAIQTKDADVYRVTRDAVLRLQLKSNMDRIDERLTEIRDAALSLHTVTCTLILKAGEVLADAGYQLGLANDPLPMPQELSQPGIIDVNGGE